MNQIKPLNKKFLTIGQTAKVIGVSLDTLRRWDKAGTLKPIRFKSGGNRYYDLESIQVFMNDLFALAKIWVSSTKANEPQPYYCSDGSVFQTRLAKLEASLRQMTGMENDCSLITASIGEIGNNSFDHNVGLWPDIRGIFFAYDINKRQIVLADRGQGILTTLKRVKPELSSDEEALLVAFTEKISGRAPESRGNGLKFVRSVITKLIQSEHIQLYFQSGSAVLNLKKGESSLAVTSSGAPFRGCMALISF